MSVQAAVDPSPLQKLAMIDAYRRMVTETTAVFAAAPAALSEEADPGARDIMPRSSPTAVSAAAADDTSVRITLWLLVLSLATYPRTRGTSMCS